MTANNCECSPGKVWYTARGATEVCPDCREARAGLFGSAVTALDRCGEELKMRDERIAEIELERDKAYEWLGAWQKWSLKLLRSWGRYQELTHPGDHGARDEIAAEVTRLRESEAKAWGLVERILIADKSYTETGGSIALGVAIENAGGALAARNADS